MLTNLEKQVIALLQTDIPVTQRPFLKMAENIGITESEFLNILSSLNDRGIMRRFGATLKHQNSGFTANAMVAWNVNEQQIEKVGTIMAQFEEITHCYRRNPTPDWKYNLYTMIHGVSEVECRFIVQKISNTVGEKDFVMLFSRQEMKKTSMRYFED